MVNFREKLRSLQTTLVFNVNYELFHILMRSLDVLEKRLATIKSRKLMNERQPLIMTALSRDALDFKEYDYRIDNSTLNGDSSPSRKENVDTSSLFPSIIEIVNNSLHGVLLFVNCAATSFGWQYKLKPIYANSSAEDDNDNDDAKDSSGSTSVAYSAAIDVIQSDEKFSINFYGLSRLGALFNSMVSVIR